MHTHPPRAGTIALTWLALVVASSLGPTPAQAQDELIAPKITDRKFPQGLFCPLPFDVAFTADGTMATIRFSTSTVFYSATGGGVEWSEQLLDNIAVAPEAVYAANLGPLGSGTDACYIGAPLTSTFYFQNAGTLPLLEKFNTDPTARGWDLAHGAYFEPTATAPHDPGTDAVFTPLGSLGLGADAPTPAQRSLSDSAYTTITVSGLTAGQDYRLTGWWDVRQMELNKIFLTVRIFGDTATELVRSTFGGVKARFHR